jgi:hypothetical protein
MSARTIKVLVLLIVSGMYWQFVCQRTGTVEPWDGDAYWRLWYPLTFVLSGVAGYVLRNDGWLAGAILTFAQLPVMWINNGTGPLIAVGVVFLFVLAVPPVAISLLTGWFATRERVA